MDFIVIAFSVVALFFTSFGVGWTLRETNQSEGEEGQCISAEDDGTEDNRFIEICYDEIDQFLGVSVLVDRDTGVAYLCHRAGHGVCSTVLVDANGKPYVYYEHKR